jgi:hypothetical protein
LFHHREEKQKERDAETHKRWLQERQEKKLELERAWKPPGMCHMNARTAIYPLSPLTEEFYTFTDPPIEGILSLFSVGE